MISKASPSLLYTFTVISDYALRLYLAMVFMFVHCPEYYSGHLVSMFIARMLFGYPVISQFISVSEPINRTSSLFSVTFFTQKCVFLTNVLHICKFCCTFAPQIRAIGIADILKGVYQRSVLAVRNLANFNHVQDLATIDVYGVQIYPFVPILVRCLRIYICATRTLTTLHEGVFIFGVGFALSV